MTPVRHLAAPWVEEPWAEVPGFMLLFGALFFPAYFLLRRRVGLSVPRAASVASCVMSAPHGLLCVLCGWQQLRAWGSLQLDLPNTPAQELLVSWSLAYLLADFFFCLLPFTPGDYLFIGHHIISALYLVGTLATRHGAISALLLFVSGESTSPIFLTFTVAKELRGTCKWADKLFHFMSPIFTVAFILVRSVLTPLPVALFCYALLFRSPAIPPAWRYPMALCPALGILASQLWSWKLLQGALKRRRAAKAGKAA